MITAFIILGILVGLYGLVATIYNKFAEEGQTKLPWGIPAAFTGIFLTALFSVITVIGAQEVGILVTPSGVKEAELHTGWHIIAPWNKVHRMDKTVWVYTFTAKQSEGSKNSDDAIWVPTKDGIKMGFDLSVSWRIDPEWGSWIYANVSENDGGNSGRYLWLEENVIRAKTKSALALTVAQFTPIEAYSNKREEIRNTAFKLLGEELKTYHLILDQIDMREVFYNPEFEKAINSKKLAEQEVLRLVEVTRQKAEELKQAAINKDIAIQQAEGEAKALQIKGTSIAANPKIIQLEWINKWNGVLPTYMMGEGGGVILNIPNDKKQ